MSSRAVRTLYRLCLRQAADLQRQGLTLEFRPPIDKQGWMLGQQSVKWAVPSPAYNIDAFKSLLPWAAEGVEQGSFSPGEVQCMIRHHFRHPTAAERTTEIELINRAISTLRVLAEQVYLAQCSSSCVTEGVFVEVTASFIGKESEVEPMHDDEEEDKNIFTYRVRVVNLSDKVVQLQARHWVVTNAQGREVVVPRWAPAVVGTRPTLEPNEGFQYYSKTDIDTREGWMRGAFQMGELRQQGGQMRLFEAEVAPFKLMLPPGS